MNPLLAIITDLHLCDSNIDKVSDSFTKSLEECCQRDIDNLFIIGDIVDSRKSISFHVLQALILLIDKAQKHKITLHLIPGNHDKISYHSKESFLDTFRHFPSVVLYDDISHIKVKDVRVWLLPFFDETTELVSRLDIIKNTIKGERNILLTHIAIDGVRNNDGSEVEGVVNRKTFELFDRVFVGHYHDRQEIDNILYIGSIIQHNYGENELKGLTIVNEDYTTEQIQVSDQIFLTVDIDLSKYTKKDIEQTLIPIYKDSGDRTRFKFIGTQEEIKKIDKTTFTSIGIDVAVKNIQEEVEIRESEVIEFSGFNKHKIIEEWELYCNKDLKKDNFRVEGRNLLEKI